jgi:ribonuclease D
MGRFVVQIFIRPLFPEALFGYPEHRTFLAWFPTLSLHPSRHKNHIYFYQDDLPPDLDFKHSVAIDTETMGLNLLRDRLCLVQLSNGSESYLVKINHPVAPAPNLKKLLLDRGVEKIFHYARFDLASLYAGLGVMCEGPIYCTKVASKLIRTFSDRHGLRVLCRELLGAEISKEEQSSDWGAEALTEAQKRYAASDVIHLHGLRSRLDSMLRRENRIELFQNVCRFLPTRARLDLMGFDLDIFAH